MESSPASIDHRPWQRLLDRYLVSSPEQPNRFAYGRVSAADRAELEGYLARLQAHDPRHYRRAEQLPYWINLYNALTVRLILDHYPVSSITKLGSGWFRFGPWDEVIAEVAGQPITLNRIEHGILRPIWRDARIHYAVNCASFGCPELAALAYTAANTELLLEQAARRYVNHPRGVRIDNGQLHLSSLYQWYRDDFGESDAALQEHLLRFADPGLAAQLSSYRGAPAVYEYDWSLNAP